MSQIAFIIIVLIEFILALYAEKRESKIAFFLCLALIIFASGFRGSTCGIDTPSYYYSISNDFPYNWLFDEAGFRFVSRFLMQKFNNATIVIAIYAAVTHTLILTRLWGMKEKCSFSYMVFMYLTIHYISSMNIMRQFLAVAIVFYATKYLEDNHFIKFTFAIALATAFHKSALLGLVFLVYYVGKYSTSKRKRMLLLLPLVLMTLVGGVYVCYYESSHIENYLSNSHNLDLNAALLYEFFCVVLVLVLEKGRIVVLIGNKRPIKEKNNEVICLSSPTTIFYLLGMITSMTGMLFTYMSRLGLFYMMFELVFWGHAAKRKSNRFYIVLSFVFALYQFVIELIHNGSGLFPYYWQFYY